MDVIFAIERLTISSSPTYLPACDLFEIKGDWTYWFELSSFPFRFLSWVATRKCIEEAYGSIWRIGNKEMGDDVDWVSLLNDLRKWFIEGVREGRVKGGVRWWDGLLEELEGRDMIGDIVFNVFFIILGSLEEASLEVFAFIVLWLVE